MNEQTMEIEKQEVETPMGIERTRTVRTYIPAVDIYELDDTVILLADMPGVSEESIDVTLEKNLLTIRGQVDLQETEESEPTYVEYYVGDYERTFALSDEVDRNKIEATINNGVLRLVMPKADEAKTRKITVRSES